MGAIAKIGIKFSYHPHPGLIYLFSSLSTGFMPVQPILNSMTIYGNHLKMMDCFVDSPKPSYLSDGWPLLLYVSRLNETDVRITNPNHLFKLDRGDVHVSLSPFFPSSAALHPFEIACSKQFKHIYMSIWNTEKYIKSTCEICTQVLRNFRMNKIFKHLYDFINKIFVTI